MSPHVFTWLPLSNLPMVPEHFVQRCQQLAEPCRDPQGDLLQQRGIVTPEFKHRIIVKNNQQYRSRCQEAFDLGPDWHQWVKDNIIQDFLETSGRLNVGIEGSTMHGAHCDGDLYRLYYLIDRGGDQAETVFYLRPGHNILYALDTPGYKAHDNMDELIEIERAQFPIRTWILFNGRVLHGVENVTKSRININISVRPEHISFNITSPSSTPELYFL